MSQQARADEASWEGHWQVEDDAGPEPSPFDDPAYGEWLEQCAREQVDEQGE